MSNKNIMLLNYSKKQFVMIAMLFLCMSQFSFGQFNSADLHSQVTQVQPMTGIVFWSNNSNLGQLSDEIQLEYSYLVYSDVIQNQGTYNWNIVDNLLAGAASRGRQMIIRFRYTYPGETNLSVPGYVRNSPDYNNSNRIFSVENQSTYVPDWSSQALQNFTKEFFTAFAARYDDDSRLAFLQIGFGSYSEYHLFDGPLTLGQTFPSKSYQIEFLNHVNGLFQETQWGISIDAASSTYTPIGSAGLQSLNYGLFDDSFLHETHSANNSEYNRASWLFFGANKYQTNAAGGEFNYFSDYDQENVLEPNGPWGTSFETLAAQYHISYMIGNDQLDYQPASRIESAGRATGYRFSVEGYETNGSTTNVTIRNTGIAPIYYDAYPAVAGVKSSTSLKGLLPGQSRNFTIFRGATGEDLTIECDRLSPGQVIQFDANIDASSGCNIGAGCDDGNSCTTGTTYDASCNCTGGTNTCGGNNCITIDQSLNDWSNIATLSSNAGFTLKAADDGSALYISVSGTIGDFGEGYQIFLDTDNSGSEFTYFSSWAQTGFDAMVENGAFSRYTGSGSDWAWSAEESIINSKTAAGVEFKIDKSLLNASSPNIRIGFASLSNWGGVAFVPNGNNAAFYTMSSALNCGSNCNTTGQSCDDGDVCTTGETYDADCNCTNGTFQDSDNDGVCDANDICAGGNDNIDSDGDGIPDFCDNCNTAGQSCDDGDVCTTGTTYDADCNCIGGTYTCGGNDCELLSNPNFDNNLNNWEHWASTVTSANGIVSITDIASLPDYWNVGFVQSGVLVEQGETYEVTFRARADGIRPLEVRIGLDIDPYTDYHYEAVTLSSNWQVYTMSFIMNSPTDNNTSFGLYMGGNTINTYIDNVSLQKADCEGDSNNPQSAYPSGVPHSIPGTINTAHYDNGGQDVAYHDTSNDNRGNGIRQDESVDTHKYNNSPDYLVGWIAGGEWLEFTVNVQGQEQQEYTVSYEVASKNGGGQFRLEYDGGVTDNINVNPTGGWGAFQTIESNNISLSPGVQVIRLYFIKPGFNIRNIIFGAQSAYETHNIPGTINATEYDNGGQGIGYYDTSEDNRGNGIRQDESVDTHKYNNSPDYLVGWIAGGEWLEFTVNVQGQGQQEYTVSYEVASKNGGGQFRLEYDGGVTNDINVNSTGGWAIFQPIQSNNISLSPGQQVIRLYFTKPGFNIRNITFQLSQPKVEQTQDVDLYVYPNPFSNELTVELPTEMESDAMSVQVIDITGKVVYERTQLNAGQIIQIKEELSNGFYILKWSDEKNKMSATRKIIKQ